MAAPEQADWVNGYRSYAMAWGLPTLLLVGALILPHPAAKTVIWATVLIWMGVACLVNARRCGRRHCYLTGPLFVIMAIFGLFHGFQIIWLGPNGWTILVLLLVVLGWGVLWYVPEKIWGKYRKPP